MPKALDPEHERMRQKLQGLDGKALDEQYMHGMVEDHKGGKIFKDEERSGSNKTIRTDNIVRTPGAPNNGIRIVE